MSKSLYQLDQDARISALDISKSFIVQAPAGSGKTELLIQRYLKLLGNVKHPEEILSITFTKKAANEMRLRVINALKRGENEFPPESEHAKLTWQLARKVLSADKELKWHIIDNPNQIRIQTIDSLCSFLTRQLPMLSHFGSQPNITEKASRLYKKAVREVLSHLEGDYEWSGSLATLLTHLDNDMDKLYQLLVHLLSKRDQWLPYIYFNMSNDDIKHEIEDTLCEVISERLLQVASLFEPATMSELAALLSYAASNLKKQAADSNIIHCVDLTSLPPCTPEHLQAWQGIAEFLLSKSDWRKKAVAGIGFIPLNQAGSKEEENDLRQLNKRYESLLKIFSGNDALKSALENITYLPAAGYSDTQWSVLCALIDALKISAAQLRLIFKQSGNIDFIENAQGALTALGTNDSPTDLALALDYQIKHILIDEFQDTSTTQYSLLEKLTTGWCDGDGRTLFVVGDPMQSIYRFREAEVGLFIKMWQSGIGQLALNPLSLSVNFRSTSDIVDWNNKHFSKIFPQQNDITNGAVKFSNSIAQSTQSDTVNPVSITGILNSNDYIHAERVVSDIRQHRQTHPADRIAILVRSRSHLAMVLPLLKKENISYRAVDINPLADRQTVIDLLSLTCAMIHLGDRISWLAILRAPWCGLTLNDLHTLTNPHPHKLIWEIINSNDNLTGLDDLALKRVRSFVAVLSSQLANRDRYNIRTWIESTWQLLGGPATVETASELQDAEEFFNLLESTDPVNIDTLTEKISTHYASSDHESDLLQIMTIHSAKGLEFDAVFIPQLHKKSPRDEKQLLLWMEQPTKDKIVPLLAPITASGSSNDSIYDYISRQQNKRAMLEIDRLFYVATTRAKKYLYLYFNTSKKADGSYSAVSGSLLEKLYPLLSSQITSQFVTSDETDKTEKILNLKPIRRLSSNWLNPSRKPASQLILHKKVSGILLDNQTPRLVGIVAHKLLQLISENGTGWWDLIAETDRLNHISSRLLQAGIAPVDIQQASNRIKSIIGNALIDPQGKWILQSHLDAKSEYAINTVVNNEVENLIIDRTFIAENGDRWIIDYKTSVNNHDELTAFLENEAAKYQLKMESYSLAFKQIDNRPIRLGLYFPALPAWKEL